MGPGRTQADRMPAAGPNATGPNATGSAVPGPDAPRLLAGWAAGATGDYASHLSRYGPLPDPAGRAARHRLVQEIHRSGLRGRGGAGFPLARKLAGVVAGGRRPIVVANGCESDPASRKDRVLLEVAAHLVLDGVQLAAAAVDADEAVLCLHRGDPLLARVQVHLRQRAGDPVAVRIVEVPHRFVASEESALVNLINTGEARPTSKPPRPYQRGIRGRPTLMSNVETLAQVALIARYGADWFRTAGTADSPGTALATVDGAVVRPGVVEVGYGLTVADLLGTTGGLSQPAQAILVGGLGGSWLPWPAAATLPVTPADLRTAGAGIGVAAFVVLPEQACGLAETAQVLRYLAAESARQCGPCMFGLPALAEDFALLAAGRTDRELAARLSRRVAVIGGRGACAHPDGAVRLAASAATVFAVDLQQHLRGRPCAWAGRATRLAVPTPVTVGGWR
jgi:NADH:ubiquinone oxidoreductase subunit F (NADH-binding)